MKRFAFSLMFIVSLIFVQPAFASAGFKNYKPGIIEESLGQGKAVLLDFYAAWCTTCRRQGRVINALAKDNPNYKKNIVFVKVNWDAYKGSDLVRKYGVPRRSTLVMLKGGRTVGKIIAQTGERQIKALLDQGL